MIGQFSPGTLPESLMIFRSNVTPEITVNLSNLFTKGDPPPEAVQGRNKLALQIIKPEVVVRAYNAEKSIAPYGKPQAGMYVYILGGIALAGLLGAIITFVICQKI